jgi:hypothetical protein
MVHLGLLVEGRRPNGGNRQPFPGG